MLFCSSAVLSLAARQAEAFVPVTLPSGTPQLLCRQLSSWARAGLFPLPPKAGTAPLVWPPGAPAPPDQAHVAHHVFNSENPRQKREGNLISQKRNTVSLTQKVFKAVGSCFLGALLSLLTSDLCFAKPREEPRTTTWHALLWYWAVP